MLTEDARKPSWEVIEGDCVGAMVAMEACSVDAVVCDPPYNLTFMGKPWDCHDGLEDAGFAYWLGGLIDGEGHFAIKAYSRGSHAPAFTLKMRGDEEGTLRLIERTLRIGSLGREDRDGNPMVKWVVQDKVGCQRLVDLLDKYPLRAKKRIDYATWREAVCEWTSRPRGNRWHGAADNTRMAHLRERLMMTRGYVEPAWSGHEFQDWCRLWGREAMRVLKPGGHLLAMGGTRTYHRLAAGIEDAGFEIRDTIAWMYGSGFPKSLDVSKAIDKAAGAEQWDGWGTALKPSHEPIVVARKPLSGTVAQTVLEHGTGALNIAATRISADDQRCTAPTSPGASRSNGADSTDDTDSSRGASPRSRSQGIGRVEASGGSPAARSHLAPSGSESGQPETPLEDSQDGYPSRRRSDDEPSHLVGEDDPEVAQLLVDARGPLAPDAEELGIPLDDLSKPSAEYIVQGRWPSNVVLAHTDECAAWECHPECPVRLLDEQTGEMRDGVAVGGLHSASGKNAIYARMERVEGAGDHGYGGSGGASRFFYCAKTSSAERNAGLDGFEAVEWASELPHTRSNLNTSTGRERQPQTSRNHHPTVKPIDLMRWLVRLVTPPGGTCLDPFAGSGTTGIAATLESFDFIGIERDPDYIEIAKARIAWWAEHPEGMALVKRLEADLERKAKTDAGQLGLFEEAGRASR